VALALNASSFSSRASRTLDLRPQQPVQLPVPDVRTPAVVRTIAALRSGRIVAGAALLVATPVVFLPRGTDLDVIVRFGAAWGTAIALFAVVFLMKRLQRCPSMPSATLSLAAPRVGIAALLPSTLQLFAALLGVTNFSPVEVAEWSPILTLSHLVLMVLVVRQAHRASRGLSTSVAAIYGITTLSALFPVGPIGVLYVGGTGVLFLPILLVPPLVARAEARLLRAAQRPAGLAAEAPLA
jgi:hypothetical protein